MNDWQPRLVALDIDGTLLKWVEGAGRDHEEVPPAVHDAVRRAHSAGAHVVLASGRSPHGMTVIADLLELPDAGAEPLWVVASNGAVVFRYPPIEVVHEETGFRRPPGGRGDPARAPHRAGGGRGARGRLPRQPAVPRRRAVRGDGHHRGRRPRGRARQPCHHPRPRLHRRGRPSSSSPPGSACTAPTTSWAGPPGCDLAPVGVNKASGVAHAAAALGVDTADVLAIGDGRNDIEMLQWAGRGVAMGQAVEEVIAAADAVTGTVYDDGAATELSRWFPPPDPGTAELPLRDGRVAAAGRPSCRCGTAELPLPLLCGVPDRQLACPGPATRVSRTGNSRVPDRQLACPGRATRHVGSG